jgi:hypothetical protein
MSIGTLAVPLWWMVLAGCAEPSGPRPGEGGWPDCDVEAGAFTELRVESTSVGTVGRAAWTTDLRGPARVVYAETDGPVRVMPAREGAEALLVGVGTASDVIWRVVVETENGPRCSEARIYRTGLHDPDVPEFTVVGADASGDLAATVLLASTGVHAVLLDASGRVVWSAHVADAPEFGPFRVRLSPDGRGLDVAYVAGAREQEGRIVRIDWDGARTERFSLRGAHTDMVERPDGTVAMLGWDIRDVGAGRTFIGDTILERAPDGETRTVWSAFDAFPPDLGYTYGNAFYATLPDAEDWTHGAGLSYDADKDSYLVALRKVSTVVRVDRATGTTLSVIGARTPLPQPGAAVDSPHSVEHLGGDRYLVFNSGGFGDGACSRATVYRHAEGGDAGEVVRDYGVDACLRVAFLGNAVAQADDSLRVAWSSAGRLESYAPGGELLQRVELPAGTAFGFVTSVAPGDLR